MSIETKDEREGLRRAGRVVAVVLRELRRRVQPGSPPASSAAHGVSVRASAPWDRAPMHQPPSVPNTPDPADSSLLHTGLVITVEPILGAGGPEIQPGDDGWTIRTADGAPAAHTEHTIVVCAGAPLVLTR